MIYNVTSIQKDLTNDNEKHYFAKNDVYFAFRLTGPNPELLFDPSYITFEISQLFYSKDNSDGYIAESIPYKLCGDKIPYIDKSTYDRLNLSSSVCPNNTDFFLRANLNSDNYGAIQLKIK